MPFNKLLEHMKENDHYKSNNSPSIEKKATIVKGTLNEKAFDNGDFFKTPMRIEFDG